MNYWKIMPGKGAQYVDDFLTEGVVRIGFVDSPDMAQASMDTLRVELRDQNPEQTERQISTSANQVYKFFHDIQAGDRMVMFHPGTRNYHRGSLQRRAPIALYAQGNLDRHRTARHASG